MTDIVERLRQCDENFDLVQETADEIERLSEAVRADREAILNLIEAERTAN